MARDLGQAIVTSCPALYSIIPISLEARGYAMLNKKCVGAVILAAMAVSSTAMAQDRGTNTVVGGLLGAAIGHSAGGRDGAIVGGVLGAAVGNSLATNDRNNGYYDNRGGYYNSPNTYYENRDSYYDNRGSYYQPAPVYVQPAPVYVQPAPVYYAPAPRYYSQPSAVVYVGGGRGYYDGYNRGYGGRGGWGGHDGHRR
jgi:hypothetical protein